MSLEHFYPDDLSIPPRLIKRQSEVLRGAPRILVTSVSALTPLGLRPDVLMARLKLGKTAIGPLGDDYDPLHGARLPFRDPIHEVLKRKFEKIYTKKEVFNITKESRTPALAALVMMAVYDLLSSAHFLDKTGHLKPEIAQDSIGGIVVGTGFGNFEEARNGPMNATAPLTIDDTRLAAIPNLFFPFAHGPSSVVTAACNSSGEAYHSAYSAILKGEADWMAVVGADLSSRTDFMDAFFNLKAISPSNRCLPMAEARDGFVMGEGAGAILLETEEHALKRRHKRRLAIAAGSGHSTDNYHETSPDPEGLAMAHAIAQAMIGVFELLRPEDVEDFVIAYYGHLTGTPIGDDRELKGLRRALSKLKNSLGSVSSLKDKTGHTMGAAAILNMIAAIYSVYDGFVVPAPYLKDMKPMEGVRAVSKKEDHIDNSHSLPAYTEVVYMRPDAAATGAAGFGGSNHSAVFIKAK